MSTRPRTLRLTLSYVYQVLTLSLPLAPKRLLMSTVVGRYWTTVPATRISLLKMIESLKLVVYRTLNFLVFDIYFSSLGNVMIGFIVHR